MIKGKQTIEIGEVCCSISFEDSFFQDEFNVILSEYRRCGFCPPKGSDINSEINIVVRGSTFSPPAYPDGKRFYHSLEYDSVYATMCFDTTMFEGEIGFAIKQVNKLTPVRIIELIGHNMSVLEHEYRHACRDLLGEKPLRHQRPDLFGSR